VPAGVAKPGSVSSQARAPMPPPPPIRPSPSEAPSMGPEAMPPTPQALSPHQASHTGTHTPLLTSAGMSAVFSEGGGSSGHQVGGIVVMSSCTCQMSIPGFSWWQKA
jgi:hypothetical protein